MSQQLTTIDNRHSHLPATILEIEEQVQLIQQLLRKVMRQDVHYGTIPGTDKPTLYKPGAEKIGLTFRLAASFDVQSVNLPGGHREYTVTCRLTARDGTPVGEGIGVCSTMEGKYRYRWDATGAPVPSEYWDTRDQSLLGGPAFVARKVKGTWQIFQRVDYDNPADYYNTVAKMAKKRAHIDAILTSTAASDIFEQDLDDLDGIPPEPPADGEPSRAPRQQPRAQTQGGDQPVTDGQVRLIKARLRDSQVSEADMLKQFGAARIEDLKKGQVNEILEFLQKGPAA